MPQLCVASNGFLLDWSSTCNTVMAVSNDTAYLMCVHIRSLRFRFVRTGHKGGSYNK